MKIGILGSGTVAKTLAAGYAGNHQVMLGTSHPAKLAEWASQNPSAAVGSFADAAAFGEVLILAVKGDAASLVLQSAGAYNLDGKTILDTCNPIENAPPVEGVLPFFTNINYSLMEQLQTAYPSANFVKTFNSVGAAVMVHPQFKFGAPTMFICGNDPAAKQTASFLIGELGWQIADMGKAEAARAIEPLCMLWCILGFTKNEWTHAFSLLRNSQ